MITMLKTKTFEETIIKGKKQSNNVFQKNIFKSTIFFYKDATAVLPRTLDTSKSII